MRTKQQRGFWESGCMKHDRKVGFINHSCSSSARDFAAETSSDGSPILHRAHATPIRCDFNVSTRDEAFI